MSSAYPSVPGLERREFLRELVSARPAIVVAGAHGKGTTAAMIAFALRETGRDPAWLIGAPVPQLGSNAGVGSGLARRRGRRVRPDGLLAARRDRRAHEHRPRPPHRVRVRGGARRGLRGAGSRRRRRSCATRRRTTGRSRVPGEQNRLNAGTALAALELAGVPRGECRGGARALHRHRPAVRGARAGRRDGRRRLRPPPDRGRRDDRGGPRALSRAPGCTSCSSRTSTRARAIWRPSSRPRSPGADDIAVTDVYPAREPPIAGVTGKLIVDALSDRGRLAAWTPTVEQGVAYLVGARAAGRRRARRGRRRRRPRGRAARARLVGLAMASVFEPEENVGLARLTTIGTGGPARWFARPRHASRSSQAALALGPRAGRSRSR